MGQGGGGCVCVWGGGGGGRGPLASCIMVQYDYRSPAAGQRNWPAAQVMTRRCLLLGANACRQRHLPPAAAAAAAAATGHWAQGEGHSGTE